MTKYQITFRCQHCGEVFKIELTLPLIFEELECPECKDMTELGRLSIREIKEINYCDCSKCTGIKSVEDYYKEEEYNYSNSLEQEKYGEDLEED